MVTTYAIIISVFCSIVVAGVSWSIKMDKLNAYLKMKKGQLTYNSKHDGGRYYNQSIVTSNFGRKTDGVPFEKQNVGINRVWIRRLSSVVPESRYYSLKDGKLLYVITGQSAIVCGRSTKAGIVFDSCDPTISKLHCKFMEDNGQWMIVDLNSKNGTYLNGDRLIPNHPVAIALGDSIHIGSAEMVMVE